MIAKKESIFKLTTKPTVSYQVEEKNAKSDMILVFTDIHIIFMKYCARISGCG